MKLNVAQRMEEFQPGIFNVLDERRQQRLAQGLPVYSLSIGTPDFLPEPHVVQALAQAASEPANYRYSLTELPELVEAVQRWYLRRYGVELEPEELMSIYGSQEGLTHIGWALCDPGDVVLVPDPGYPIFEMGPALCGAEIVHYPLKEENGYAIDEFYHKLIDFAKAHNIIILHDNAYSDIIFDGREGKSFLAYEGAKEVGVEYNSLSKTYNLTGARISFVLGNRQIIQTFRRLRSQIDYGIFLPVQHAAIAALNGPQDSVARNRAEYQARRDALCGGLRSIGWNVPDSQGSMFVWAPLPTGYHNSVDFCFELLKNPLKIPCTLLICNNLP